MRETIVIVGDVSPAPELLRGLAARGFEHHLVREGAPFEAPRGPVAGVFCLHEWQLRRAAAIADELGVRYLTAAQVEVGRDKYLMKARLQEGGLTVAEHALYDPLAEEGAPFPFPFIIKPRSGYASSGVRLVRDEDDLEEAIEDVEVINMIITHSEGEPTTGMLCERFVRGPEFSVDALTVGGETRALLVCDRDFPGPDDFRDFVYRSHDGLGADIGLSPTDLYEEVEHVVGAALRALEYHDGPSHTELRYDLDHQRWVVLEAGLRVGGSGGLGALHRALTGFDYNLAATLAACHRWTVDELRAAPTCIDHNGIWLAVPVPRPGVIAKVHGRDLVETLDGARSIFFDMKEGERIAPPPHGFHLLAWVVLTASEASELPTLVEQALARVFIDYA